MTQSSSTRHSVPVRTARPPAPIPTSHPSSLAPPKQNGPLPDLLVLPPVQQKTESEKRIVRTPTVASQAPNADPMMAVEGMPGLYGRQTLENRARRGSSSTVGSYSSALSSWESVEGRMRSSSWGSQTSFESMSSPAQKGLAASRLSYANYQLQNSGQHVPWRPQVQRPAPIKAYRIKRKPGELFAALPGEVLELIMDWLKKLHLQPGSASCATCWMRDCCAVALSAKKWLKFARVSLYEDIQLIGAEGTALKKRYKVNHNARLVLLRRSLRNNPRLGGMVRSLKVPNMLPPGVALEDYHSLVASVIMACPNLERVAGFYPKYDHVFSRLFQALTIRERLKDMTWIVEASPHQRLQGRPSTSNQSLAPDNLHPHQARGFFDHHGSWSHLTNLTIHCRPGATLTPDYLITDSLRRLPSLQTLHLSHLPHTSFNDSSLLSLPSLKHLTLAHLPGVTTAGFSTFATRHTATRITTLTLVHVNVDSLPALARIFANLTSLQTFNLVQSSLPSMPPDEFIMLFPYLASPSVRRLHWDIPYLPTRATIADTILSRSIAAGGFPSLRSLRTPNDPEGLFQSLCKPRERIDEVADRYRHPRPMSSHNRSQSQVRMGSRSSSFDHRSPPPSPGFPPPSNEFMPRENSDLHSARLAAQARLEAAKRYPKFSVNIIDPAGNLVERHGVGAFIGTLDSRINYVLTPDLGGTDEGGGLVRIKELLAENGEEVGVMSAPTTLAKKDRERDRSASRERNGERSTVKGREGCCGKWNVGVGIINDKKEKERIMHTERGRWRGVVMS